MTIQAAVVTHERTLGASRGAMNDHTAAQLQRGRAAASNAAPSAKSLTYGQTSQHAPQVLTANHTSFVLLLPAGKSAAASVLAGRTSMASQPRIGHHVPPTVHGRRKSPCAATNARPHSGQRATGVPGT